MRTIEIRDHSDQGGGRVTATIRYDGHRVSFGGDTAAVDALKRGAIVLGPAGREVVLPSAGAPYLDAVLAMYRRMSYGTAEEVANA